MCRIQPLTLCGLAQVPLWVSVSPSFIRGSCTGTGLQGTSSSKIGSVSPEAAGGLMFVLLMTTGGGLGAGWSRMVSLSAV